MKATYQGEEKWKCERGKDAGTGERERDRWKFERERADGRGGEGRLLSVSRFVRLISSQ